MIASTSHDMRTPLNTILSMRIFNALTYFKGMITLIKSYASSDQMLKEWLNIASNSTNLLLYLVNDTLDYFQIKSGKFKEKL